MRPKPRLHSGLVCWVRLAAHLSIYLVFPTREGGFMLPWFLVLLGRLLFYGTADNCQQTTIPS